MEYGLNYRRNVEAELGLEWNNLLIIKIFLILKDKE